MAGDQLEDRPRAAGAVANAARMQIARRPYPGLLAAGLCVVAFLATAQVSIVVFDRVPHLQDEVAYLFQAKTIASVRILADTPARPEFFEMPFIIAHGGRWFGKYPPGFPAVLALGVLIGQPWLVNPLLAALSVGLVYLVGRRLYGVPTGLLAATLLVVSPFLLLQAGTFMSHVAGLFWVLVFLLLFEVADRRRLAPAALGSGIALGVLFLSRPVTAFGVGAPFALWAAIAVLRSWRRLPDYLPILLGSLPFVAVLLAYNWLTTGAPLRSAYELWWPFDKYGFGTGIGPNGNHTLEQGLAAARFYVNALADSLFGWPDRLSLFPAALAAVLALETLVRRSVRRVANRAQDDGGRRPGAADAHVAAPPEAWDLLHAGVVVGLVLVYVPYWFGGHVYGGGPRYYFEALGALVLLSARGILQGAGLASVLLQPAVPSYGSARAAATVATLLVVVGLFIHSFSSFAPQQFSHYTRWNGIDGSGVRQAQAAELEHALVFVEATNWTDYAPFFCANTPSLDSNVVYAIDLGDEYDGSLMALYPERAYFRYANGQLMPVARRALLERP